VPGLPEWYNMKWNNCFMFYLLQIFHLVQQAPKYNSWSIWEYLYCVRGFIPSCSWWWIFLLPESY
jgi:hypothetical protein